ncbi:hypothetical protein GUJ93_ZPchr0002g26756 [Zizania palustris]|uniref:Uncharacterized protein n=1 Tax=Zizania palustris TaxID=103762 RepID=A0A8J5VTM8_ZIZPA|nr:hypothetical protein GUJ93_ZPchr0002g26756 [Zizania palustris]
MCLSLPRHVVPPNLELILVQRYGRVVPASCVAVLPLVTRALCWLARNGLVCSAVAVECHGPLWNKVGWFPTDLCAQSGVIWRCGVERMRSGVGLVVGLVVLFSL